MIILEQYKNKRLAGIDFGLKRVGLALCDELHITTTPKGILDWTAESFWAELQQFLQENNVAAVVVGVPVRHDGQTTAVIEKIDAFISELKERTALDVYTFDESYTSKKAMETMISIGRKKKKRAQKGSKDEIAAAIILRDFIFENS